MPDTKPDAKPRRRRRRPRGYSATKAAQVAAYFLIQGGGEIQKLKLVKLLYLAERRCAEIYGRLLFFDRHFAAAHGPIPTQSLNGIDGETDKTEWSSNVVRDGNIIRAVPGRTVRDLDDLTGADKMILDELLGQFGGRDGMTAGAIRDWTHEKLAEYKEKEGELRAGRSSVEITPYDLAKGFGHPNPDEFVEIDEELRDLGEY